jgi:hypothetical protein
MDTKDERGIRRKQQKSIHEDDLPFVFFDLRNNYQVPDEKQRNEKREEGVTWGNLNQQPRRKEPDQPRQDLIVVSVNEKRIDEEGERAESGSQRSTMLSCVLGELFHSIFCRSGCSSLERRGFFCSSDPSSVP